jgi:hypothetical protein
MAAERSIVGDLINFRGLVYSPINEQGVVFVFGKVANDLNMYVEEIKTGFPDCIARRFTGKGWERVGIEFEFKSSSFERHGHDPQQCDIIVCWEHDWPGAPVEVIELREVVKDLPNPPTERPDASVNVITGVTDTLDAYFARRGTNRTAQRLYRQMEEAVRAIDDEVWVKISDKSITYYSPARVFAYVRGQKTQIRIQPFTRGEPIPGVTPFGFARGGHKWGQIVLKTDGDLEKVVAALKEAHRRIREAIKNNENTGWFAELEGDEDDELDQGELDDQGRLAEQQAS